MEWRWFGEKQPISFRIRGTIGYELSTDFNFSMSPESAGDDVLELPTQSTPIGSVNSSGATVGLTLVAGF